MPFPDDGATSVIPLYLRRVPFPSTQATVAKDACSRIAALLEDHLLARPSLVASAQDGWEGVHRVDFDETWSIQQVRLSHLKDDLLKLAGAIDDAASCAATTNLQRAEARADYLAGGAA